MVKEIGKHAADLGSPGLSDGILLSNGQYDDYLDEHKFHLRNRSGSWTATSLEVVPYGV
jgi:hypothetical protein